MHLKLRVAALVSNMRNMRVVSPLTDREGFPKIIQTKYFSVSVSVLESSSIHFIYLSEAFFSFIGQLETEEADRKWGEIEGNDMQQGSPVGIESATFMLPRPLQDC